MNKADVILGETYMVKNADEANQANDLVVYIKGKTKPQFINLRTKMMSYCSFDNIDQVELKINPLENENIIINGNGGGAESPAISLEFPQDAENNEYRYVCPDWLNEIAIGLTAGAEKHPGETWRKIPADEHLARALRHINLYRMGDRSENHLVNSSMRLMMAFATQEVGKDD